MEITPINTVILIVGITRRTIVIRASTTAKLTVCLDRKSYSSSIQSQEKKKWQLNLGLDSDIIKWR